MWLVILGPLYILIIGFLGILPAGQLPVEVEPALTLIFSFYKYANYYLPMDSFFAVVITIFGVETSILTYYLIMWVIHRLPTQ